MHKSMMIQGSLCELKSRNCAMPLQNSTTMESTTQPPQRLESSQRLLRHHKLILLAIDSQLILVAQLLVAEEK